MLLCVKSWLALLVLVSRAVSLWYGTSSHVRVRLVSVSERGVVVTNAGPGQKPREVVEVPIDASVVNCLKGLKSGGLADRDGGFLDRAPWARARVTSREAYEVLKFGSGKSYERLLEACQKAFGDLSETLIEDAWPGRGRVRLEGALRFDTDQIVVDCFADEAIGLAAVSGCPLFLERKTFDAIKTSTSDVGREAQQEDDDDDEEAPRQQRPETIKSGAQYARLSTDDKVDALVAAGVTKRNFPRPRAMNDDPRGYDASLDDLLLPLCDEIARREVMIERALELGDQRTAAALIAGKSQRHKAYDRANDASTDGDFGAELKATYDKSVYDASKADVTQDDGDYNRFLDRDPWYEEQLRRNRSS